MKRLLVLCLLGISLPWTILAQTAREDLKANPPSISPIMADMVRAGSSPQIAMNVS